MTGRWSPTTPRAVLGTGAGVATAYAGLGAAAAAGAGWVFLVLVLVAYLLDRVAAETPALIDVLRAAQLGISNRGFVRDLALALLFARVSWATGGERFLLLAVALALPLARVAYLALLVPLRRRLATPVPVRNVDLSGLDLAPAPPAILTESPAARLFQLGALPAAAGGLAAGLRSAVPFLVVAAAVLLLLAAGLAGLLRGLLLARGRLRGDALVEAVHQRVLALRPEVILYFSGSGKTMYQVDTWLPTMDALDRRALILLREASTLPLLGPTDTPVICIPSSVHLMNFGLPDARVALYPTNVGKNIHLLRVPAVTHVFIGHGDSDKTASFNPFSKVYTQIWVAGPAGRDRYLRARVGVRAEEVVEVGRPQLGAIRPAARTDSGPLLTVLYAPTWEGWTDDPFHSSLVLEGAVLMERLLESRPRVRVVYKPHPLTGTVSRAATAAHEQVVALLAQDNASRTAAPDVPRPAAALPAAPPDLVPDGSLRPAEQAARYAAWSQAWWAAEPAEAHRVVMGAGPTLYDCYNHADVLIADISSVVSDWLASEKPYAVPNLAGLTDAAFRERYPSAGAAYLLEPGPDGIPGLLAAVRGADPMAAQRRAYRTYLLGASTPDPVAPFRAAVDAAGATARETWPDRPALALDAGG